MGLRIAIFNPYLHILGGGERYILTIASLLSLDNNVDCFFPENLQNKIVSVFGLNTKRVNFISNNIINSKNLFKKINLLRQYDILFFMTDGSLSWPLAKNNYLIIQSPLHIPEANIINRWKLFGWKTICYSNFMKDIIKNKLNKKAITLSPCIDVDKFTCSYSDKENIILSVGRFFRHLHNKRQDVLIGIFKNYYHKYFRGWKLVIAGGITDTEGERIVDKLKSDSSSYPIEVLTDVPFERLINLYQRAKIYWHAAGYGYDQQKYPEKAEHFGITTLEAMAAGVVPLAFNAGGQKDIIKNGKNGYLWNNQEELIDKSSKLIKDQRLIKDIADNARRQAEEYSCHKFNEKLHKIVGG